MINTGDEIVMAFDLGTGGCKTSLWGTDGSCLGEYFSSYPTSHSRAEFNEQNPEDWWNAVVSSTKELIAQSPEFAKRVRGISSSGQSLGILQLDNQGELLDDLVPIWSDARGTDYTELVFRQVSEEDWYSRTGNGFPAGCYPVFKAGWLKENSPDAWGKTTHLIGSKDYINFRLTGDISTDHSYASGTGAYSLSTGSYSDEILDAAQLKRGLFPEIVESHDVVGHLKAEAAELLGLEAGIPVFAGAVDNSCMALGSLGTKEGRIYAALGSSSWITVTSSEPIIDVDTRPYVFRHALPGFHVSALSTFSSGTSLEWLRATVAPDLDTESFINLGLDVAPGASGLLFLPMLAGGTPLEGGPQARGVISGLSLGTSRGDLARSALEGIAFSLRRSLDHMRRLSGSSEDLLVSGGGARSDGWNQIYAEILNSTLIKSNIDQQAATLGAATIGFVGLGLWDYTDAEVPHTIVKTYVPSESEKTYGHLQSKFDSVLSALTN